VRTYLARVPILSPETIHSALKQETNSYVFGKLLQNPALDAETLSHVFSLMKPNSTLSNSNTETILALDSRLTNSQRRERCSQLQRSAGTRLAVAIHEWHLWPVTEPYSN
jgi:hypothetical protein